MESSSFIVIDSLSRSSLILSPVESETESDRDRNLLLIVEKVLRFSTYSVLSTLADIIGDFTRIACTHIFLYSY